MANGHQTLPASGPHRERLREKGQFWTPDWVADAMVAYVAPGSDSIFDPAVGAGAFLRAAKRLAEEIGRSLRLFGTELDPSVLAQAREQGLSEADLAGVQIRDFLLDPPAEPFKAITANPPYVRHHRLSAHLKKALRTFAATLVGRRLDGRAGLHVYFLLRALQLLGADGHLAFILPADTFEGVFAKALWDWITRKFRLDAVVTFAPEASPFPQVDTNAVVVMLRNVPPAAEFTWAFCRRAETRGLTTWVLSGCKPAETGDISATTRAVSEGIATGLSRPPRASETGPTLGDFASVMRGVATGANDFFFLTVDKANSLGIPRNLLVPAVGRTRDVRGDEVNEATIKALEEIGRPTLLFCPDGRSLDTFPARVRDYLRKGELDGIHQRPLIATRRPWYKMETRPVPPILFAYLGRRNARFIQNRAGVIPLTGFLCIYPRRRDREFLNHLWRILSDAETTANLPLVGKSYGGGAVKVEPRALEQLPLPAGLLRKYPLRFSSPIRLPFDDFDDAEVAASAAV